jgi:hypothetical protein
VQRTIEIPPENREQAYLFIKDITLLKQVIGWPIIDKMLFYHLVPKKGGKRIRKKRAARLRARMMCGELGAIINGHKWRDFFPNEIQDKKHFTDA